MADDTTTAEDEAEAGADADAGGPADDLRDGIVARFVEALGDAVVDRHVHPGDDMWVRVTPAAWGDAARLARDGLGCRYFCFLSAVDWLPSPYGRGEDDPTEPPPQRSTTVEQGYAGGDTRLQVLARVVNTAEHWGLNLKVDVPEDTLTVPSWTQVYAGADWHERETWEMFGIVFDGHPSLRHIYLPGDFEGHPLRKDFPLLARMVKPWPGIVDVEPMPADPAEAATPETDEAAAASEGEGTAPEPGVQSDEGGDR